MNGTIASLLEEGYHYASIINFWTEV